MAHPGQLHVDTATGNVGVGTSTPNTNLQVVNLSTTTGARQYALDVRGIGADIIPLIHASAGGLPIKTVAGIEMTSVDAPQSEHGRHSYIEAVSAGSTYNTDIEFRVRAGSAHQYSRGSSPAQKQQEFHMTV